MPTKSDILLDSIRKLLALNVSDREIILNLGDVGVGEEEAKKLIEQAKKPAAARPQPSGESDVEEIVSAIEKEKKQREEESEKTSEEESAEEETPFEEEQPAEEEIGEEEPLHAEEIAADLMGEKHEEEEPRAEEEKAPETKITRVPPPKPKKAAKQAAPVAEKKRPSQAAAGRPVETVDLSKLWEKGILTAINQRLAEMKKIREELDAVLDRKVDAATKREQQKIKVLLDSQRVLMVTKVDAELEAKANQLMSMIEAKMLEMRGVSGKIEADLSRIKDEKQGSIQLTQQAIKSLGELQKTKQALVAEMNSELIKAKSDAQQFLESAKERLDEIDERVNKTLQLENEVAEGLVKDAESRMMKKMESGGFGTKAAAGELSDLRDSKAALEAQIKEKLAKIDKLYESFGKQGAQQQKLAQQMSELEEFKKQFVKAIEFNVEKFNKSIKQLNEAGAKEEEQINLRIQKIDKKIVELDNFEKNFAKEMGIALNTLTEKKKS
ncbi:MAG: hypothetical protein NTW59_01795 [Candidatus Diapherotrites archaeon]|nr:hypothetical protein [Candidatus Diapherotrites archaeon]